MRLKARGVEGVIFVQRVVVGFSAASSNASIATCHGVLSCSDLGRVKIYCLASSSVRSVLPSGKTTGRSRRLSQDTTQLLKMLYRPAIAEYRSTMRATFQNPKCGAIFPA